MLHTRFCICTAQNGPSKINIPTLFLLHLNTPWLYLLTHNTSSPSLLHLIFKLQKFPEMMSVNGRTSTTNTTTRYPFTASQWQELEHQALVYKYMVSGMPIPSDLLFTIRRSLDSSLSSNFLIQPQHSK